MEKMISVKYIIGIKLPIMVHTDDTIMFEDLGMEVKDEDCKSKDFTFYHIDIIVSRKSNPKHTIITVSGETYICLLPIEKVERMISNSAHSNCNEQHG